MALSVLLPAVSPRTSLIACEKYVEDLLSAVHDLLNGSPALNVICGMDAVDPASQILADRLAAQHDSASLQRLQLCTFQDKPPRQARQAGLDFCRLVAKPNERYTPICWMWQQLAIHAQYHFQPEAFVLLGDDIKVQPTRWAEQVLGGLLDHNTALQPRQQVECHCTRSSNLSDKCSTLWMQEGSCVSLACTALFCEMWQTLASRRFL